MSTAIKLVAIYFIILQIASPILVAMPCTIYLLIITGASDMTVLMQMIIIPSQVVSVLLMTGYLWKAGYISKEKAVWSPVSLGYLGLSAVVLLSSVWLLSELMSHLKWLPNIMEQTFDVLQSGWLGILVIAIIGPVLEELLFRGAITKVLLQKCKPAQAIVISALIFGVIHLNPAQILPAFFLGLLFAWMYYKTGSLIPCILMHVLNNSLSIYLSLKFPEEDYLDALISDNVGLGITCVSCVLLLGGLLLMNRVVVNYPWKSNEILINKENESS